MNVPAILHAGHGYPHASDCGRQPRLRAAAPAPQVTAVASGKARRRSIAGSFPQLTAAGSEGGSRAGDVGSGVEQQRSSGGASNSPGELTHQSPGRINAYSNPSLLMEFQHSSPPEQGRGCVNLSRSKGSPEQTAGGRRLPCCSAQPPPPLCRHHPAPKHKRKEQS